MAYYTEEQLEKIADSPEMEKRASRHIMESFSNARLSIFLSHNADDVPIPQSGELWHLAFGAVGMPMKRVIDFEGLDEKDSPLGREGILRKYDFIAGLAVHYEGKFWGAALRCRQNINAVEFLQDLCEEVAIETPETIA